MKHGQAAWFEIPVSNMDRAIKFYNEILKFNLEKEVLFDKEFGVFKKEKNAIGGVLIFKENFVPGKETIMFFYVAVMSDILNNLKSTNGVIVTPKTLIRQRNTQGETIISSNLIDENVGYYAEIIDSEGNHIGLYGNS